MDLTTYGSELRLDGALGSVTGLAAELYQPMGGRGSFGAVLGGLFRINENFYEDDQLVSVFRRELSFARGDLGWTFTAGQLRVGYQVAHASVERRVGPPPTGTTSGSERAIVATTVADTRDAAFFARTGLRLNSNLIWYLDAVDTEKELGRLNASRSLPFPVGRWNRGLVRAEVNTLMGPAAPAFCKPTLGGPYRLSAFGGDAFRGRHALLGHLAYLHSLAKLPDPLGDRLYAVGLFELGSAFEELSQAQVKFSATGGLAFDGFFGPVSAGLSVGNGGSTRFFFTFGRLVN
jgi:hypothetical protein